MVAGQKNLLGNFFNHQHPCTYGYRKRYPAVGGGHPHINIGSHALVGIENDTQHTTKAPYTQPQVLKIIPNREEGWVD